MLIIDAQRDIARLGYEEARLLEAKSTIESMPQETKKIETPNINLNRSAEPTLKEATKDIPGKGSGTKDACYYKVRSRYKVWPSAYASGALVRCRKVGADNWGNKSKKVNEEYTRLQEAGNTYSILLSWKGIYRMIQFFVPGFIRPSKSDITNEVNKIYPGAKVLNFKPSLKDPTKPYFFFGVCNEKSRKS